MKSKIKSTIENLEDGSFLKLVYIVCKNLKNKTIQNHIKSAIKNNPRSIYADKDYFEIYFIICAFMVLATLIFSVSLNSLIFFGIFGFLGQVLVSAIAASFVLIPAFFLAGFMIVKKDKKTTING